LSIQFTNAYCISDSNSRIKRAITTGVPVYSIEADMILFLDFQTRTKFFLPNSVFDKQAKYHSIPQGVFLKRLLLGFHL